MQIFIDYTVICHYKKVYNKYTAKFSFFIATVKVP